MKIKYLKPFVSFTVIALLAPSLIFNNAVAAENQVKPTKVINGVIINQSILVPLRDIFENLGATVKWDETTKKITATKDNKTIVLTVDEIAAYINNKVHILSVTPQVINGKTMVPARFVSEALGVKVDWDSENRVVSIGDHIKVDIPPDLNAVSKLMDDAKDLFFKVGRQDAETLKIDFQNDNSLLIANAFNRRIPQLSNYFSDQYINTVLSPAYKIFFYPTSYNLFPSSNVLNVRPTIIQDSDNTLRVQGVSFADDLAQTYTFEIRLIKKDSQWKIDSLVRDNINKNLAITENEAIQYAVNIYDKVKYYGKITMDRTSNPFNLDGEYYHFLAIQKQTVDGNTLVNEGFDIVISPETGYLVQLAKEYLPVQ